MEKDFKEGYARRLSPEEMKTEPPLYYLPHFGVPKDRHDESKGLRVVYDGSAKYKGKSINMAVRPGPTLLNSLADVVTRFRNGAIAWAADIKAMFSRLRLRTSDQKFHGFIWTERDGSTSTCMRTRVTFGISCSPVTAIRATWKAADGAPPSGVDVAKAIREHVYVDDYLDSADDPNRAIRIAMAVAAALKAADFHLVGWVSNSPELLAALNVQAGPPKEGGPPGDVLLGDYEGSEPLLGMTWRPSTDTFGFKVNDHGPIEFTRLGVLSLVASQFDPLGAAATHIVKGKIKCRIHNVQGLDWTDPLDQEEREWWQQYFHVQQQLRAIEFPRCLFPEASRLIETELHTFCDASEEAISAVVYLRLLYDDSRVLVRFVKGVTKLVSLKTVSTNKNELNAALLGARLAKEIAKALGLPITRRYFWTDSSTVRNWVRATAAFYQTYVSVRIGEIQTLTEAHEWRFVPGKLNPADAATRSDLEEEAIPAVWLNSTFLALPKDDWPVDLPWMKVSDEMRNVHAHSIIAKAAPFDWSQMVLTAKDIPALVQLDETY